MFTLTLDSIMEKLHIAEGVDGNSARNIFDELAAKIENNLEKQYITLFLSSLHQ